MGNQEGRKARHTTNAAGAKTSVAREALLQRQSPQITAYFTQILSLPNSSRHFQQWEETVPGQTALSKTITPWQAMLLAIAFVGAGCGLGMRFGRAGQPTVMKLFLQTPRLAQLRKPTPPQRRYADRRRTANDDRRDNAQDPGGDTSAEFAELV
jgi:hypothetical protein